MTSDIDYRAWLSSADRQVVWLAELDYPGGTELLARGTYTQPGTDVWRNALLDIKMRRGLDNSQTIQHIEVRNTGRFDDWLHHDWLGQPIRLYLGDRRWPRADFQLRGQLINGGIEAADNGTIRFKAWDRLSVLDVPVQPLVDDERQPLTFGQPFNVSPKLADNNLLYIAGANTISAVRDAGYPPAQHAVEPGGFRLGQMPVGTITCDPVAAGGTAAELVQLLCDGTDLVPDADALAQLPAWPLGIYAGNGESRRDLLNQLCTSLGAHAVINALGRLELRRLNPPAATPDGELRPGAIRSLKIRAVEPAYGEVIIRYAKNWTVQEQGLVAGVTAADLQRYGQQYLELTATLSANPLAPEYELDTVFTELAAAEELMEQVKALRSQARIRAEVVCVPAEVQLIEPGQTWRLSYPRFGFNSGVNALVLANDLSRATLEVLI